MDSSDTKDWLPPRYDAESVGDWTDRLREDMQGHWRDGNPVRLGQYLRALPALADDREAVLDLIAQEYLLRSEAGEGPTAEEYVGLFPSWEGEIRQQLAVEDMLAGLGSEDTRSDTLDLARELENAQQEMPSIPERFQLIDWLGEGGFGRVGLCRDTVHGRLVALKLIHAVHANAPTHRERFRREAEVAAGLNHPNVCTLHEHHLSHTPPFIVFEYVEGPTLTVVLQSTGPLPVLEAVRIARDVAAALAHCHSHGIIHRDLKPDNIKQRLDGVIKVLDLGLARPFTPAREQLSSSDAVLGTLVYSSPEQIRSPGTIGPASDQFSLGVVLYELLTGHRPFPGATSGQVIDRIQVHPPTPMCQYRPELDDAIISIVLRLLEKDPTERFTSMTEVQQVLEDYLAGNRQPVPRRQRWSRREVILAGSGLLALLATLGALSWKGLDPAGKPDSLATQPPAPPPPATVRPAADLATLLQQIATDLASQNAESQPGVRYLSLVHLANDSHVPAEHLQRVRDALNALLPKLSSSGEPVRLEPVAGSPTLLRLHLRHLGWSHGRQWEAIVRCNPYSLRYNALDLEPAVHAPGSTIAKLVDNDLTPFLLADWLVAVASDEPLSSELLQLTLEDDDEVQRRMTAIRANPLIQQMRVGYIAAPVDLQRACAELGLADVERLKTLLLGKDELTGRLRLGGWLQNEGIPRSLWLQPNVEAAPFAEVATELKLGVRRLLR